MASTASPAFALEEAIKEEEALTRVYAAEIALLRQNSSQEINNDDSSCSDTDSQSSVALVHQQHDKADSEKSNALLWILKNSTGENNEMSTQSSILVESLTQSIQGFVVSSIQQQQFDTNTNTLISSTTSETETLLYPQQNYVIRGHFVANPSVSACIQMTMEMLTNPLLLQQQQQLQQQQPYHKQHKNNINVTNNPSSRRKRRRDTDGHSRVVRLECTLSSSTGNDLSHIIHNHTNTKIQAENNLPVWIQSVSSYLEFERQRNKAINRWKTRSQSILEGAKVVVVPSTTETASRGSPHETNATHENKDEPKSNRILPAFCWEWNWDQQHDTLRLVNDDETTTHHYQNGIGLTAKGLQDLVTCAGGCESALDLIFDSVE